jgi:putative SOS response-associated peptidase YedK
VLANKAHYERRLPPAILQDELLHFGIDHRSKLSLDALQWGLIPYWAKDPKIAYRTINARAETVDKAPSYRQAFKKRRCLIPADGF